jgi:ABC-type branched-subunit amino acid transport system ATPase component
MSALLDIRGLKAGYIPEVDVLQGIDLSVNSGETIGILGLNGSGKSSIAKAIAGQIPFRTGSILFNGDSLMTVRPDRLRAMGISYMRQEGGVFGNLTVEENLYLASRDVQYLPSFFAAKKKMQADRLSGGERQLLAFSMALSSNTKLLILDEPSAGLSPSAADEIYETMKRIIRERALTVLLIEQNVARAVSLSTRVAWVADGRLAIEPADFEYLKNKYFV